MCVYSFSCADSGKNRIVVVEIDDNLHIACSLVSTGFSESNPKALHLLSLHPSLLLFSFLLPPCLNGANSVNTRPEGHTV